MCCFHRWFFSASPAFTCCSTWNTWICITYMIVYVSCDAGKGQQTSSEPPTMEAKQSVTRQRNLFHIWIQHTIERTAFLDVSPCSSTRCRLPAGRKTSDRPEHFLHAVPRGLYCSLLLLTGEQSDLQWASCRGSNTCSPPEKGPVGIFTFLYQSVKGLKWRQKKKEGRAWQQHL